MKKNQLIALAIAAAAGVASAESVYFQDFDVQGAGYTTSTDGLGGPGIEFSDGGFDFFTQSDTAVNSSINYNGANGGYFAAMDTNGSPGPSALPLYLTTDTFSIAGYSDLAFAVDLAEDLAGNGADDWDILDFVHFEYQVDGGAWNNIFSVLNDQVTPFNTKAFVNGVAVTDTFSTFNADLSGVSGSTMALRVVWSLNSGDEDLAIDGLSIIGQSIAIVPLPTSVFAGLGMLGLLGVARRFRK